MLRKSISTSSMILFGGLTTLALCAEPLIKILLGENWIEAVPFLQWYCLIGMTFPLQTSSAQAINALGLSSIYLKIMSFKRIMGIILLVSFTIFFKSVYAIVFAAFLVEVLSIFLHMWYNMKLLRYSITEQIRDIIKYIFGVIFLLIVYILMESLLPQNPYAEILTIGLLSIVIYMFVLYILKSEEQKYLLHKLLYRSKIFLIH